MSKFYKLNIKPLSVNKAWKGRRYATKESKSYQKELWLLLPPKIYIPEGMLEITFFNFIAQNCTEASPASTYM
jgi:hypothetical protein